MDDSKYAAGVGYDFDSLRADFERYEDIKHTYGLSDADPIWQQNEFLKDLKGAVTASAQFLTDVIKTPDVSCAVAAAKAPTQIIAVVPLRQISANAITCFDKENVGLNPNYVIVGQGGKSFKSMKDPASTNNYLDQIDVRGIWIDKLIALNTLLERTTGIVNFDQYHDNFLDIADVAAPAREALEQVLSDEVVTDIQLVTADGGTVSGQIGTQFYNPEVGQNGHMIVKPLDDRAAQMFQISDHIPFESKVVSILKQTLGSREQELDPDSLLNGIDVIKLRPTDGALRKGYVAIQIGKDVYATSQTSSTALTAMNGFTLTTVLGGLGEDKVKAILADVKAGKQPPTTATDEEKLAYSLSADDLEKFLGGGFQAPIFYAEMIKAMSQPGASSAGKVATGDDD
jgi:hypothetical protein